MLVNEWTTCNYDYFCGGWITCNYISNTLLHPTFLLICHRECERRDDCTWCHEPDNGPACHPGVYSCDLTRGTMTIIIAVCAVLGAAFLVLLITLLVLCKLGKICKSEGNGQTELSLFPDNASVFGNDSMTSSRPTSGLYESNDFVSVEKKDDSVTGDNSVRYNPPGKLVCNRKLDQKDTIHADLGPGKTGGDS